MSRPKREVRTFTVADIAARFELASYWFGAKWFPAVHRPNGREGYGIRIVRSSTTYSTGDRTTYDYFELDADGVISTAPRGYAKDYKPGRVTDIAAVADEQVTPDPDARRGA
jgi:hypothetical protein